MTGYQIYEMALDLVGVRLSDGSIPDTASDLEARCVSLINMLITENTFLNGLITGTVSAPQHITSLNDSLTLDEKLQFFALPYGLCALLMTSEDVNAASFMQSRYAAAISKIRNELPGTAAGTTEIY